MGNNASKGGKQPAPAAAPGFFTCACGAAADVIPLTSNARVSTSDQIEIVASRQVSEHVGAPKPENEAPRNDHLCNLNILDTVPEKRFDDITRLCCVVFKIPIALVSLVDKDRQWFKSVQGLATDTTSRKASFCAWTLLPQHPEVLVVEDALEDVRFSNNPLVTGPPHIRFYAGCPLVATNELRLGSLCIIDVVPHRFDAQSCNLLANMAEMVVREIEKEAMLQAQTQKGLELSQQNQKLLRTIDCFREGVLLLNLSEPEWLILFVNEAFGNLAGLRETATPGMGFWELFQEADQPGTSSRHKYELAIQQQQSFNLSVRHIGSVGPGKWIHLAFRCADNETIDAYMPVVGIPPSLEPFRSSNDGPSYYFATVSTAPSSGHSTSSSTTTTSRPAFTLIHTKVDPFEDVKLGTLLGRGAYGRVYRGQWNGTQVAVKVLETLAKADNSDLMEALLGQRISHPNVVQTYKYNTRPSSPACDAENEGAATVETWMRHSLFEVNYASVLATAGEIASAMTYLHARCILHGDLTAHNVMLCSSEKDERKWTAKVADFGLSRVFDGVEKITTNSYGTVTHMPPELLLDGALTLASDVFAFGVIMWEMYSGQHPYAGMSHGQIIHHITSGKVLSIGASCPPKLRDFIRACCAFKPTDRPTFPAILKLLDSLQRELCM
ncbi:MAG: hypothetical protein WDW36_001918 [Sanguina aurantia]